MTRYSWASFVGNAGVRALFNLDDFESAEYWSKFIGDRLVETSSRQEDIYGLSAGRNVGETMRPLLSTDRLMMDFAAGKMLVLAQGARPIITDRAPYYTDKNLAGLWDDPRVSVQPPLAASVPPVSPAPASASASGGTGPSTSPGPGPKGPDPQPAQKRQTYGSVNFTMPPQGMWRGADPSASRPGSNGPRKP